MARPGRFSPEVRERAVRMVFEHAQNHPSQWAAIVSIAEKIGCSAETLRHWVRQAERDGGRQRRRVGGHGSYRPQPSHGHRHDAGPPGAAPTLTSGRQRAGRAATAPRALRCDAAPSRMATELGGHRPSLSSALAPRHPIS